MWAVVVVTNKYFYGKVLAAVIVAITQAADIPTSVKVNCVELIELSKIRIGLDDA